MIACVVVTYNPDVETFIHSLSSIATQVDCIYIVDNGSLFDFKDLLCFDNVSFHSLGQNFGIGYAQNYGIKLALRSGSEFIMLSDQDTIYPVQYTSIMKRSLSFHKEAGAVAPVFEDDRSKKVYKFFSENTYFLRKFSAKSGQCYIFQTIASGMLIRSDTLKRVGLMNEELFIDWVDFEWCWRVTSYGYKILLNSDVKIFHSLGDSVLNTSFIDLHVRSSLRHYYITRNAFFLSLYSDYLSRTRKVALFLRSLRYLAGFPILKPHVQNFKMVFLGFFHGLIRIQGKFRDREEK